jgi:hypothetical protein
VQENGDAEYFVILEDDVSFDMVPLYPEREFFIDNLLVRIHSIIEKI